MSRKACDEDCRWIVTLENPGLSLRIMNISMYEEWVPKVQGFDGYRNLISQAKGRRIEYLTGIFRVNRSYWTPVFSYYFIIVCFASAFITNDIFKGVMGYVDND